MRWALVGLLALAAAAAAVAVSVQAGSFAYLVYVGASLVLGAVACTILVWTVKSWRTRAAPADDVLFGDDLEARGSFSVTVYRQREEAELEATVSRLVAGGHRPSEVLIVVGSDDPGTHAVAERVAGRHAGLVKVVVEGAPSDVMTGEVRARASPAVVLARTARATGRALDRGANQVAGRLVPALVRRVLMPALVGAARPARGLVLGALVGLQALAAGAARLARELARRAPRRALIGLLGVAAVAAAVAASMQTVWFVYLLYLGVSLLLGGVAWTNLVWMVSAWRTPGSLADSGLGRADLESTLSFSLIVPARHEEAVLEATLSRLVKSDHPDFEVLVVVGSDDPGTREVADRVAGRHPELVKVVLDDCWPKSKPKALNTALPYCTGAITGVFDAEDVVHPALLARVDQCFQRTNADVVQAGVQLMNFRSSWLTVRNVLEYYFWFRSRLHFQARQGFIPLGGNTVFVRTQVLRAVSGWDANCLAEDCELGVRLSAFGANTVVFYEPELVTREECPPTLGAFARQRTRWDQGYLQTLSRGYWRRLPLRQRALGAYTLAMPYLMAVVWLTIPVAIATAVAVNAPVPITLISFLPALLMLSTLGVEVAGLGDFCRTYGERALARDYARLVLGVLLYQAVLAFAAARAVAREARGDRGWEKTTHLGLHLAQPTGEEGEQTDPSLSVPARPRRRSRSGARLLERREVGPALSQRLASTNGTVESNADAPTSGPIAASTEEAPLPTPLEAVSSDRALGAGNGHGEGPHCPSDDLPGAVRGQPLWVRLDAVSTDGSASPSLPRAAEVARVPRSRLGDARAVLRRAVASRAELLVLVALLAGVGTVQATNMLHWPDMHFDEGTYVSNAWAVEHGALAPYTYSYAHPPLSWLLIAVWTWALGIFGDGTYSIDTGRQLMFVVTLVSCSLLFTLARRLDMGLAFAAGAVILFAVCPVGLFYHRTVLLDNVAIAWALAAFVLALTPRRRLWAFAGSGACFAVSVLSKETALILLPALLLAAARNVDKGTRRYCLTLFVSFLGLVALAYPLYATLKGELLPGSGHVSLVGAIVEQLVTREATGSVFDPDSTSRATVMAWLELDPWLLGSALVLSPIALAHRTTRVVALAYLVQVVMILRPGYLPNMYVIGLLPFAALIVTGTGDALWRKFRASTASSPAAIGCVAAALLLAVPTPVVLTRWAHGAETAMTARPDEPARAARRWLVKNVGHEKRLIVDDEFWIHLVEHGFDAEPVRGGFFSRKVVSYWPLDYDPAVKRHSPNGWRDFDYIVSTEPIRATTERTPEAALALNHSRQVVQFGSGAGRIEIRAITGAHRSD